MIVPESLRGSALVVIVARHLATTGLLEAFADQVRLRRGRFGTYEAIDFLARLLGYAISGERTLSDFFECVAPFEPAFMALFGRSSLPQRSRALVASWLMAIVLARDAFRTLFEQHFAQGWTKASMGGIFDRQGRRDTRL